ncbi:unnamed protein product [Porites evermanni]|uniref:Uncharacterized protein n=2 Tax=Porites TaxID=46719 RepID=A0ABN8SWA7_9CNID|nr:unnamed protein product [Porites evermanni]
MGSSTSLARIGSFSSPYIIHLRLVHPLLPYAIMGGNALLAGLLCMTLPETKGMPTAETMDSEEDAKESIELQGTFSKKDAEEMKEMLMDDAEK